MGLFVRFHPKYFEAEPTRRGQLHLRINYTCAMNEPTAGVSESVPLLRICLYDSGLCIPIIPALVSGGRRTPDHHESIGELVRTGLRPQLHPQASFLN
jgi:hypothetical protein